MNSPGRRYADRPELAPLWQAAHHRLSAGRPVSRLRVGPLTPEGRSALADLLGLDRLPDAYTSVDLARLDTALLEICGHGVRAVVADIVGPLGDRAAEREAERTRRADLWAWLDAHPTVTAQPALAAWTAQLRRTGLIAGSVDRTRESLEQALRTLAALPAQGEPLPVFATAVLSDSHALDDGTRLSSLVLRALATLHETPAPESAADRRALWGRAGIADDALSTTVLTAGFHPSGSGPLARALTAYSEAGHAAHLTLAQLRTPGDLRFPAQHVHITENPSILALALSRFGPSCPPMVCTSGWPNSAAMLLLRHLAAADCHLHYHGDLDGEGLRIAAHILAKTPAKPWRMTTADYLTALRSAERGPDPGRITEAPWDQELAGALREAGASVVEERVAEVLLGDLAVHVRNRIRR
ncbi:TIGR02679 family protein [Streptomyces sp. NPDC050610]|uniref:TIGR02679 family protein n=1 Tax=Streptomyces sp. NPDC050610 TaxID=3157097 RepID=UPI003423F60B